ncbi:hypothetical protein PSI9734_02112 [Pseudidiomarina piscicola]|uniref:Uncharacterized protein n=1 Tax=Pseudidiomarina piscicola TaxID=2614830 RepID=A0A6S6WSI3_9GAMM|nr:hypothetical protein [Pseudidiomarina piscicola]CAB0151744.1 hypothetical protein PSI9734_02112 [Pseudidiomarina piscicola]VZT41201.1 hypothetical protein PSI9734_02112 [Pseudomonas aeruginosa]
MYKQRSHKKLASGFIVASVMIGAALFTDLGPTTQAPSDTKCQQASSLTDEAQLAQQCTLQTGTNELSWSSWFSGNSRSTQFHFMDLFELLFGDSNHSQSDYGSNKKVSIG